MGAAGAVTKAIERIFSRRAPRGGLFAPEFGAVRTGGLAPGDHVVVVGGGIAGTALARQLLRLGSREGLDLRVTIVDAFNCNYCGGLLTRLALETLEELYAYPLNPELILGEITRMAYVNPCGSVDVELGISLKTILRTDKFGYPGFDDYFRQHPLEGLEGIRGQLAVIESARVTRIVAPGPGGGWLVQYHTYSPDTGMVGHVLRADFVVVASGLRSLPTRMMRDFSRQTGYRPPPVMESSVTEVDCSGLRLNELKDRVLIVDNVVPGCAVGIISKKEDWLTVTALNGYLTREQLAALFASRHVREYVEMDDVVERLRCKTICRASVYTGRAENICGDGWLVLGDLTGYGRVLKDGYFAALYGAHLAAWTLVYRGTDRASLLRHYERPLRSFVGDNRVGMKLFRWNAALSSRSRVPELLIGLARREGGGRGGFLHAALRGLVTGELSYRWIAALFALGLLPAVPRLVGGKGSSCDYDNELDLGRPTS